MGEPQHRKTPLDPAIARLIADATGAVPRFAAAPRPDSPPALPLTPPAAAANRRQRRRLAKSRHPPAAAPAAGGPDAVLAAAIAHHRAGRLRQAEAHYHRIIARDPDDPVAGHFLAVVA